MKEDQPERRHEHKPLGGEEASVFTVFMLIFIVPPALGAYLGHQGYPWWLSAIIAPILCISAGVWLWGWKVEKKSGKEKE